MTSTNNGVIAGKTRTEITDEGQVARILLAAPKANILDRAMMHEMISALDALGSRADLKAIVLEGEGQHFSFGASVEEHLPDEIAKTLPLLHVLLKALADAAAPTIAAVRGQCLGGGLELALACDFIVAEESAQFGLPEIKLGVFPPAGAALLPVRIGTGRSGELILTGRSWSAAAAFSAGLVNKVVACGELAAAVAGWIQSEFIPRSAPALRLAARAARRPMVRALREELPELERMYLDELMRHPDAEEGIQAFLEKRPPRWAPSLQ
jgi:cyclohexa-1,5-dienecarbonyl-CoA hydratase